MEQPLQFTFSDPHKRLRGIRLQQDVRLPGELLDFHRDGDDWLLTVPRPDVDRMEYAFELLHADGSEIVCDPGNPHRVGGAFGDKSELTLSGYRMPGWLSERAPTGERRDVSVPTRGLEQDVPAVLWSAADTDPEEPLPLLVVHDGPEYDSLARLTQFLDVMAAQGTLRPMRAALLAPVDRNDHYSASTTYSRALALGVLPYLQRELPTTQVIGMGASLGGLAMLHAQRRHPGQFAGLYLQSSSFFHPVLDENESGFSRFRRVTAFVDEVLRTSTAAEPLPVVLTCGLIEENVENNRLMQRALGAQGYDTRLVENRDVHTYTGWRDTFDPHLTDLVCRVLDGPG